MRSVVQPTFLAHCVSNASVFILSGSMTEDIRESLLKYSCLKSFIYHSNGTNILINSEPGLKMISGSVCNEMHFQTQLFLNGYFLDWHLR